MPCFHPLRGWRSRTVNPETGRRSIVFKKEQGFEDMEVKLPCGKCIGCRLEYSRQWAVRCVHEAQMHEKNCFITLTYANDQLPEGGTLVKDHFQKFMKRLRKQFGSGIRYFQCGEYGNQNYRPHYHACLFNMDFPDKVLFKTSDQSKLYTSAALQKLWPFGFSTIGDVTFDSAAYVARYVMKKVTGDKADEHYQGRVPEYTTMSRRPGLAKPWFDEFKNDLYPSDYLVLNGNKMKIPKFYDNCLDRILPHELETIKAQRRAAIDPHDEERTLRRLRVKETVQYSRAELLTRKMEKE